VRRQIKQWSKIDPKSKQEIQQWLSSLSRKELDDLLFPPFNGVNARPTNKIGLTAAPPPSPSCDTARDESGNSLLPNCHPEEIRPPEEEFEQQIWKAFDDAVRKNRDLEKDEAYQLMHMLLDGIDVCSSNDRKRLLEDRHGKSELKAKLAKVMGLYRNAVTNWASSHPDKARRIDPSLNFARIVRKATAVAFQKEIDRRPPNVTAGSPRPNPADTKTFPPKSFGSG
jgi:hypothetical protein